MNATVLNLLDLRAFTGDLAAVLAAPDEPTGPQDAVQAIIADVRIRGDIAARYPTPARKQSLCRASLRLSLER